MRTPAVPRGRSTRDPHQAHHRGQERQNLAGARAAGSHTGALATRDVLVDALLTQAGVVRVATLEELFDAATVLSSERGEVVGRRIAIVTNAGGPGILTADACEARGLTVPVLGERNGSTHSNAWPRGGRAQPARPARRRVGRAAFDVAIPMVLGDPGVDALIVECVPTTSTDVRDVARVIARAVSTRKSPS